MHAPRRLFPTILAVTLAVALAVTSAQAGNVFVQIQCGNPPELAETPHSVALAGSFSSDSSASRWLVPLVGRIDAIRIDDTPFTVATGQIDDGFLEVDELGRIFVAASQEPPGYRIVVLDSQVEKIERDAEIRFPATVADL